MTYKNVGGRGWDLPILVLYLAEKRLDLRGIVNQNNNNNGSIGNFGNPLRVLTNPFRAPDAEAIRTLRGNIFPIPWTFW